MRTILKYSSVVVVIVGCSFIFFGAIPKNKASPQPVEVDANAVDDSTIAKKLRTTLVKHSTNLISTDDVLHIWVRDEPDLDRKVLVTSDGGIYFSFIGDIQASGRTPEEVKDDIRSRLLRYIPNPEVFVSVIKEDIISN